MKAISKNLLGVAAVILMFHGTGMAREGINLGEKGQLTPDGQAIVDYAMAVQLVSFGIAREDPLSLITAARVMQMTPTQNPKREKTTEGGGKDESTKAAHKYDLTTPSGVLAKAKEMVGDRKDLLAMIDDASASTTRGRVGGPALHTDRVEAGATDVYKLTFRGDESARVLIKGDGDTDLDCYADDENGNRISSDTDSTDSCVLQWTPAWTGVYAVKIKNYGRVYSRYVLMTN